jgi:hypothetical protein
MPALVEQFAFEKDHRTQSLQFLSNQTHTTMKTNPTSENATPTSANKAFERTRHANFSVELEPLPREQNQDYLPLKVKGPEPLRPMNFDRPGW